MPELSVLKCKACDEYIPVKLTFADVADNCFSISVLEADKVAAQLEHDLIKGTSNA